MSAPAAAPASDTSTPTTATPATDPSPTDPAIEGAQPAPEQTPVSTPTPEPAPEVVIINEGAKQDIAAQGDTIGAVVEQLDEWALVIGSVRISAFDVMFLFATVLLVVSAAWFGSRFARNLLRRANGLDGTQKLLAEKLVTVAIWTLAFFIMIDVIGIDLTALAFFGGAFGLAIGFGLQKTFGNLISGILLLLDKSIKPGDVISVSDQAGNEAVGQIRKIGIRAISVVTRDQTEHLIPNENLMVNQVVNWSYSSKDVRVKAPIGVAYDSNLKLVTRLLYQAADETDRVLKTPKPRVNIMEFGDNSVNFELRFWIHDPEAGIANIRSDVFMRIWELFRENEVEIPFPQRDLHLRSSKQLDQLVELMSAGKLQKD